MSGGLSVRLEHMFYTLVPHKGYAIRAKSPGFDVGDLEGLVRGWYAPYDEAMFRRGLEARYAGKSPGGYIYYARLFLGHALDELKRDGVVSHIASLGEDEFNEAGVSFKGIESAMAGYVEREGIGLGDLEPIELESGAGGEDLDLRYLKATVPEEQARKLLQGFEKDYPKVLVIYKRGHEERVRLAWGIARLLNYHGLDRFLVFSDIPMSHVTTLLDHIVVITDKMIPLTVAQDWTIVNIPVSQAQSSRKRRDVDDTLRRIYGG